jgi:hypothetical protein
MFDEGFRVNPELVALWRAQDEADEIVGCTNYPDLFYPDVRGVGMASNTQMARDLCAACPIVAMCAAYGINHEEHGIWGGLTEDDRKSIRRLRGMAA